MLRGPPGPETVEEYPRRASGPASVRNPSLLTLKGRRAAFSSLAVVIYQVMIWLLILASENPFLPRVSEEEKKHR